MDISSLYTSTLQVEGITTAREGHAHGEIAPSQSREIFHDTMLSFYNK